MISEQELLQIKDRLLAAAEAAHRIATSNEPVVRYTEEEYTRVYLAMTSLPADLSAVLSELDTLRNLFVDRINEFFKGHEVTNEIPVGGDSVAGVPDEESQRSGGEARDDEAVPSQPAPARRVRRRRAKGAESGGDTAGVPDAPTQVDARAEG
jgi:hypothetical protein